MGKGKGGKGKEGKGLEGWENHPNFSTPKTLLVTALIITPML